jgi:hypothetical protein
MITDLSTDTDLLNTNEPTHAELAREFVRPGHYFKGEALKPYTAGTDLLFTQVLDRNDATMTAILSFVFIHRSTVKREELLALCWDKPKFRAALLDWIESIGPLTAEDHKAADDIFLAMRTAAQKSEVEVVPDASDLSQKKMKASRQRKSRL